MSPDDIIATLREYNRGPVIEGRAFGSRNGRAMLTEEEVRQIKRMIRQHVRPKVIMSHFPRLSYRNYWYIASGKHWGHVA